MRAAIHRNVAAEGFDDRRVVFGQLMHARFEPLHALPKVAVRGAELFDLFRVLGHWEANGAMPATYQTFAAPGFKGAPGP